MALDLTELRLLDRYSTNRNDLLAEFYRPCLESSYAYDRAAGYFRSSFLLLASRAVAEFCIRGGKIRLICSPNLTEDDVQAIQRGYEWRNTLAAAISRDIEEAVEHSLGRSITQFLATLIAVECLDVKVAFRLGARGIFHDKVGIFRDQKGEAVSFTGSSNETYSAWNPGGNHESFDVFRSWTSEVSRVRQHQQYFDDLWSGREVGLEVIHFPDVVKEHLNTFVNPEGLEVAYEQLETELGKVGMQSTSHKIPLPHQSEALHSWRRNECRGILEHATGSGKTFTAILAIRDWIKRSGPVIVLVPSELLLYQWKQEITAELKDLAPKLLLVGGGNTRWKQPNVVEGFTLDSKVPRITLATLQSASKPNFYNRVQDGDHLCVVIDEVHRAGSSTYSSVFSINAGARLGLSATPKRYGDPDGTSRIMQYFGQILQPPFTLADAIAAKRLSRYSYHIHPIELSEREVEDWRALTQKVRREVARVPRDVSGEIVFTKQVELLLFHRSKILKQAEAKVSLAVHVLQQHYQMGQRWLVYCDSQEQLLNVRKALASVNLSSDEYHSAMIGDKASTMEYLKTIGGILVAIRCLDEGVDIPTVDNALILASSKNPREFIQRRGRVLRTAPDKFFANIHDALVLPPKDSDETGEIAILEGELARAVQFAEHAENDSVKFQLRDLAREYGIDPDSVVALTGYEDEYDEQ